MTLLFDQQLEASIQTPQFTKGEITFQDGEEILKKLRPILRSRMATTIYNRAAIAEEFVDHYLSHPGSSPLEALATFHIRCELISDLLPENIRAYPIGAILSKKDQQFAGPLYSHVAVAVAFQNQKKEHAYILLDPNFGIAEPILLKNYDTFVAYDHDNRICRYSLLENKIICSRENPPWETPCSKNEIDNSILTYRLDHFQNPEEASALPLFPVDRKYPIISRYENGSVRALINIDLKKREIEWRIGDKASSLISFDSLSKEPFDQAFAALFLTDKKELNDCVVRVAEHADLFDRLYFDYISRLHESVHLHSLLKNPSEIQI